MVDMPSSLPPLCVLVAAFGCHGWIPSATATAASVLRHSLYSTLTLFGRHSLFVEEDTFIHCGVHLRELQLGLEKILFYYKVVCLGIPVARNFLFFWKKVSIFIQFLINIVILGNYL